jgi:hypothetical protein
MLLAPESSDNLKVRVVSGVDTLRETYRTTLPNLNTFDVGDLDHANRLLLFVASPLSTFICLFRSIGKLPVCVRRTDELVTFRCDDGVETFYFCDYVFHSVFPLVDYETGFNEATVLPFILIFIESDCHVVKVRSEVDLVDLSNDCLTFDEVIPIQRQIVDNNTLPNFGITHLLLQVVKEHVANLLAGITIITYELFQRLTSVFSDENALYPA